MATFSDANLEKAYNSIYNQLQNSGGYTPIAMPEKTLESITAELSPILRPQYEQAIKSLYGLTKQQKAAIDVDAASRGMGTSTWVTDAKNRAMNSVTEQVAGLESDYATQLASQALQQYQQWEADKAANDKYNQGLAHALGEDAYNRAIQQLQLGLISPVGKGGNPKPNPNPNPDPLEETKDPDPLEETKDSEEDAITEGEVPIIPTPAKIFKGGSNKNYLVNNTLNGNLGTRAILR